MALQNLTVENFEEQVSAAPLAMVDFWAEWCGHCVALTPTVDALAERYAGRVLVGKVNVDESKALARRFGVMSIPTVIFLKDGREIGRLMGEQPEEEFAAVLDASL